MNTDPNLPCELILKIGCNEYDEIFTAINTLLRTCSINDEKFFSIERQIQPTTYFGSFTNQLSIGNNPIQSQSISCVIFLTDELFHEHKIKKDFFKSTHIWNFHHKIELLNEYKQIIARQDYYELSNSLPLWSISHIPSNKRIIIRFNIFTKNFDLMLKFYEYLFQRKPDSSKIGFGLYNLSSKKYSYQFSIKYSPSIQSYSISQCAYLKIHLNNLDYFLQEYTSKLFTINPYEYYIYDPDGNLLHLYLNNKILTSNEYLTSKSVIHTNDSGFGDSSEPSIPLFNSNISPIYVDEQNSSSNDSGQCSSVSSNEIYPIKNQISVRSANTSEIDYRLKQQQQQSIVLPPISRKGQECKPSLYESEPRLSNRTNSNNRCYSSMNNIQSFQHIRPYSMNYLKSSLLKKLNHNHDYDVSYEVDSPRIQSKTITDASSSGYLNTFLLKKQQQKEQELDYAQTVKQLISQFEKSNRPKSAPLINQPLSIKKSILPPPTRHKSPSSLRSKSVTLDWQNSNQDDKEKLDNLINQRENSRINIGITLDSRLRKTPVLDMLRSTTMQSDIIESQRLNRTYSFKHSFIPIARF